MKILKRNKKRKLNLNKFLNNSDKIIKVWNKKSLFIET